MIIRHCLMDGSPVVRLDRSIRLCCSLGSSFEEGLSSGGACDCSYFLTYADVKESIFFHSSGAFCFIMFIASSLKIEVFWIFCASFVMACRKENSGLLE